MDSTDENFEKKIAKAKEILDSLTNPEVTLLKSMQLYSLGIKELKEATKLLEDAKLKFKEASSE